MIHPMRTQPTIVWLFARVLQVAAQLTVAVMYAVVILGIGISSFAPPAKKHHVGLRSG